jgi:hypothetical protein
MRFQAQRRYVEGICRLLPFNSVRTFHQRLRRKGGLWGGKEEGYGYRREGKGQRWREDRAGQRKEKEDELFVVKNLGVSENE